MTTQWHRWFAWWPVRVTYIPADPEECWRETVWCKWAERRQFEGEWMYRVLWLNAQRQKFLWLPHRVYMAQHGVMGWRWLTWVEVYT